MKNLQKYLFMCMHSHVILRGITFCLYGQYRLIPENSFQQQWKTFICILLGQWNLIAQDLVTENITSSNTRKRVIPDESESLYKAVPPGLPVQEMNFLEQKTHISQIFLVHTNNTHEKKLLRNRQRSHVIKLAGESACSLALGRDTN